jgi:hypothetical protein
VKWGKINFEGADVYERIKDAHPKVRALADEFDADFVCLEGAILANNKNVKVTIDLSLMYGAILSVLLAGRAKVVQVTPMDLAELHWEQGVQPVETRKLLKKTSLASLPRGTLTRSARIASSGRWTSSIRSGRT